MNQDDQLPTVLALPATLPYPITISKLLPRPGDQVTRGQKIMSYTYVLEEMESILVDSDGEEIRKGSTKEGTRKMKKRRTRVGGSWDCPLEGEFVQWESGIKEGLVIKESGANFLHVQEACVHPMVFAGLCAVCGKDLTAQHDYLDVAKPGGSSAGFGMPSEFQGQQGNDEEAREGLRIDHDDSRVTVSAKEAHRLALAHRKHLLANRKLILVIDLDQTVIHAAVDPTIGDWLDECGLGESSKIPPLWEFKKEKKDKKKDGKTEEGEQEGAKITEIEDDEMDTETEQAAEERRKAKGKAKASADGEAKGNVSNPNAEALKDVFRFQLPEELHPDYKGKGKRKLEIDPKTNWYYVKPRPGLSTFLESMSTMYELHVYTAGSRTYADAVCKGIDPDGRFFGERILSRDESGNIAVKSLKRLFPTDQSMVVVIDDRYEVWNHAPNLLKVVPYDFFVGMGDINSAFVAPRATDGSPSPATVDASGSPVADIVMAEEAAAETAQVLQQTSDIAEQLEERPLAKAQAELESAVSEQNVIATATPGSGVPPGVVQRHRALLKAKDGEMGRLEVQLREVHGRFFTSFDQTTDGYRVPASTEPDPRILYDVRHIIPHMRRKVLNGCVIVFSGMIAQDQMPEQTEFWILAKAFGAECRRNLSPGVTHLVTTQADTQKAHQAFRTAGVKVVWKKWLQHSFDVWYRQPSAAYLVPPPTYPPVSAEAEPVESTTPPGEPAGAVDVDMEGEAGGDGEGEAEELALLSRGNKLVLDFDEAELEAEMEREMMDDDSEMGSINGSQTATPTKKRSRPSSVTDSPQPSFDDLGSGKPFKKRARFADADGEMASEFADVEVERDEEDYDEYEDEDGKGDGDEEGMQSEQ